MNIFDHYSELLDESVEKSGDLYIRSVCFSPDGKLLATGAEDKQIRVSATSKQIKQEFMFSCFNLSPAVQQIFNY